MLTVIDGGTTTELTPGRQIRPVMDCDKAVQLVRSLYGFTVLDVHQMDSYDDRNFHVRVSAENHRNPHVQHVSPHGYVLKVMNSIDSLKPHVGENLVCKCTYSCCFDAVGWATGGAPDPSQGACTTGQAVGQDIDVRGDASVKVTKHSTIPYIRYCFLLCNSNLSFRRAVFPIFDFKNVVTLKSESEVTQGH